MSQSVTTTNITHADVIVPQTSLLAKLPMIFGIIGLVGIAASIALALPSAETKMQFFFSWHTSFLFFLSIALGGLFFVLIQFASRAAWSVVVRRIAENAMATLPVFALLFIPVIFGMHTIFHWTHLDVVANDPILLGKQPYLNEPFFFIRAGIYFLLWILMARYFHSRSVSQDHTGSHDTTRSLQKMSYPGIAAASLTATFASFDWIMSLEPHWFSAIFGIYFFAGAIVSMFAFLLLWSSILRGVGKMNSIITDEHYHDLGKLLFGFTVFWTYIAYSQHFLIWYANIPETTMWFEYRMRGSWENVTFFLAVGHFIIPFFFLLPRTIKRTRTLVTIGALWMLMIHFVDIYWQVMPTIQVLQYHEGHEVTFGFAPSLLDITCFLGVGGIFLAVFTWFLKKYALIPARDPRLPESLAFENL